MQASIYASLKWRSHYLTHLVPMGLKVVTGIRDLDPCLVKLLFEHVGSFKNLLPEQNQKSVNTLHSLLRGMGSRNWKLFVVVGQVARW